MAPTRPRLHLSRNVHRAGLMAVVVIAALMLSAGVKPITAALSEPAPPRA
jgi:hypothetical protein